MQFSVCRVSSVTFVVCKVYYIYCAKYAVCSLKSKQFLVCSVQGVEGNLVKALHHCKLENMKKLIEP